MSFPKSCFFVICFFFSFLIRFHSIDLKYQVWKLGVVFTDNVSVVSHLIAAADLVFTCPPVPTMIKIKVLFPSIDVSRLYNQCCV